MCCPSVPFSAHSVCVCVCVRRRHGDLSTTALLEGTIYPEEVTHCAAGVRWLTHLHRTALQTVRSAGATPATAGPAHESSSAQNGDIDSSTATTRHANGQPSTAPDQACNHAHAHDQKNPSTTGNQVTNAPGRPITANGQVPSTCQGSSTVQGDACSNAIGSHCVPAWMSEASQFDTVQEWCVWWGYTHTHTQTHWSFETGRCILDVMVCVRVSIEWRVDAAMRSSCTQIRTHDIVCVLGLNVS